MEIALAFIEKYIVRGEVHENFILTSYVDVYPSYKAGDKLFLQITNREDETKSKKLTEFKITDVVHSIRENTSRNARSEKNPMGITVHMGMEIYVRSFLME